MGLSNQIHLLEEYGPVAPSVFTQPVRYPEVNFDDGILVEEGTTNLVTNPSFELGLTGWTASGAVVASLSALRAKVGNQSALLVFTGTTGSDQFFTGVAGLTVGTPSTLSVDVFSLGPTSFVLAVSGVTSSTPTVTLGQWSRVSLTFTPTATTHTIQVRATSVGSLHVDAVQVEAKPYATSYASGAMATGFRGSKNLFPSAAATFEDGTTGGWTRAGGAGTLSNSAERSSNGQRSLRLVSGGAGTIAKSPLFATTPGRQYTAQFRVFRPTASATAPIFGEVRSSADIQLTTSAFLTVNEAFTLLTMTFTATTGLSYISVALDTGTTAGQEFYLDSVQIEEGSTASEFVDDFNLGEDKTPGNLLPAAAQSFEDGTTGSWVSTGNSTVANSTVTALSGTRSLLVTCNNSTQTATQRTASGTAGLPVVAGRTYTFSIAALTTSGRTTFSADLIFYDSAGTAIGARITGALASFVANNYVRGYVTAVAPVNAVYVAVASSIPATGTPTANDLVYFDAGRLSEGTADAAYRWNGAEHASTSTRAAAAVTHPLTSPASPLTVAAWVRVGEVGSGGNRTFVNVDNGTDQERYRLGTSAGAVNAIKSVAGTNITTTLGATVQTGDALFVALTFNGASLVASASVNGAALLTATTATTTVPATPTNVRLGVNQGQNSFSNGPVESVLIYNRVLTTAEIADLAFGPVQMDILDDPGIVYSAGTIATKGTGNALTPAGKGRFRRSRTFAAELQPLDGVQPSLNNATHRVSVPSGSGIGEGSVLSLDPNGRGTRYRVVRAFANGGSPDELYAVIAA